MSLDICVALIQHNEKIKTGSFQQTLWLSYTLTMVSYIKGGMQAKGI
jgi:hypothetical protein